MNANEGHAQVYAKHRTDLSLFDVSDKSRSKAVTILTVQLSRYFKESNQRLMKPVN